MITGRPEILHEQLTGSQRPGSRGIMAVTRLPRNGGGFPAPPPCSARMPARLRHGPQRGKPVLDADVVQSFATALAIGALIGLEREKRKTEEQDASAPGLRTFIMVALVGAVGGWLAKSMESPSFMVAALLSVAAAVVAAYVMGGRIKVDDLGFTTEIAAIAVCLLAGLAMLG